MNSLIGLIAKLWPAGSARLPRISLSRLSLRGMGLLLLACLALSMPTGDAFAISAGCKAVNTYWSRTYTVSEWAMPDFNSASGFAAGDVIHYSVDETSNSSPYISIYQFRTTIVQPSIMNLTGQQSGSITISDASNSLYAMVSTGELSANGRTKPDSNIGRILSATLRITCTPAVASPVVSSISPTSGTVAGGTSVTIHGSNFSTTAADNSVTFGGTNATVSAATATQLTVSTPAHAAGSVDVTVRTADGTGTLANGYTYQPASPTISVSASNATPALGTSVTFTATLSGGSSPTGNVMFIADGQTMLGTGTISGTTATFSTATLAVGSHSITAVYEGDSNNATATSSAVTVTVAPPTFVFSPSAGPLPAGTKNAAYNQSVSATASDSTAPITYAVSAGSLPAGLSLNESTGAISGTPTATGDFSFTITARDSASPPNSGSASYTLTIGAGAAIVFSPAGGALPEAMAGEAYQQTISASGGTGALHYRLASGALPDGLVLNVSTGQLTGPLDQNAAVKDYSFTIEVEDGNGATASAAYTLAVKARRITVTDHVVVVPTASAPANVDLTEGATGGPFVSADLVTVDPPNAGTASIVRGEFAQVSGPTGPLGWYLKFTPDPAYAGVVHVQYRLTSALGISNTGTVTYMTSYVEGKVAAELSGLTRDFVKTRQSLIASAIKVPGLLDRRQMGGGGQPVTAHLTPSSQGVTTTFATSLAQIRAAANASGNASGGDMLAFNVWADGTLLMHNRDQNGSKWGGFGMISTGADYLISDKALIGLSFHYDRMTDPTDGDADLVGNGWLAGPYASFEVGSGVYWDSSLLYGGSSNTTKTDFWSGSFDTSRWLLDSSVKGTWRIDEATTLSPTLRAVYLSETVDGYSASNSLGDRVGVPGFTEEQLRVSLGAEVARQFILDDGAVLTPKLGLTGGVSGLDGSGGFGQIKADVSLQTSADWTLDLGLLFNLGDGGEMSTGAKAGLNKRF